MAKFKDNGKLKLLIIVGTRPEMVRRAHHRYTKERTYVTGSPMAEVRMAA